jgi:hypothetical protein
MAKRILTLLVLSLTLFITPSWADCTTHSDDVVTIACQFSPGATSATFDFGTDGVITFQFDTVLGSGFELDVTAVEDTSVDYTTPSFTGPDFPAAGTACIPYNGTGGNGGRCVRYNVTGAGGGAVPVKGVNFTGLITVLLNYSSFPIVGIPAFGHAPGDTTNAPFSENILTFYVDPGASNCTNSCGGDPGMGGKVPNISSFQAFKIPFTSPVPSNGYTVCNVPPGSSGLTASFQNSNSNNPIVEVSFVLAASGGNCVSGPFLRDKTATLSVASVGSLTVAPLINGGDSNKFHFDSHNGVNVQDINTNGNSGNTNGLQTGNYYVTVISTMFSPITTTFSVP